MAMNIDKLRADFPQLTANDSQAWHYLDSAATALVPNITVDALDDYYRHNATAYGGLHSRSQKTTLLFDETRELARRFINAARAEEIVFTKGATEAINLLAATVGELQATKGGAVVVTAMEHHSNFVPWQQLAHKHNLEFVVVPVFSDGTLDIKFLNEIIDTKVVAILALTHASNTTGVINPIKEITRRAHKHNIPVIVDGAQAIAHLKVDIQSLDADFYVFSGHKLYGPTGVGVLYGKQSWLNILPPYQTGGKMIAHVTNANTEFLKAPYRFEAGTPPIASVIGLGATLKYLSNLPRVEILEYEQQLLESAYQQLKQVSGLQFVGPQTDKISLVSFTVEGIHAHDLGTIADHFNVAIRTGHLCTEPLLSALNLPAVARASLAFYNTPADIKALVNSIKHAQKILL